jgi:hypothetical protein
MHRHVNCQQACRQAYAQQQQQQQQQQEQQQHQAAQRQIGRLLLYVTCVLKNQLMKDWRHVPCSSAAVCAHRMLYAHNKLYAHHTAP